MILARPSPTCAYDDDRLRLPPASPARNSKAGKKDSMGRRLSQLCPPYATPSSNSSLDYRRSDARIVENGFATSGGLSKSAKVVLTQVIDLSPPLLHAGRPCDSVCYTSQTMSRTEGGPASSCSKWTLASLQ